ncbi:MAG TPA: hypothetical protein VFV66_17130 [Nonomuraea sp.]|nr:hypothetical protein [Nonomuraea sp.]
MGDNKHQTYSLKPSGEGWTNSPDNRNVEQILNLIRTFNAEPIDGAALAYRDAHKAVTAAREAIKVEARNLATVWEGPASVEAQKALGILYVTLGELADKLLKMANPLSDFADVVRGHQSFLNDDWKGFMLPAWHYQGFWNMGGITNSGSWNDDITDYYGTYTGYYGRNGEQLNSTEEKWGSPNELAGLHLQIFGEDLKHIFTRMPDKLDETLRDIKPPTGPGPQFPPVTYPFGDGTGPGNVTPVSYGNDDLAGYNPGGQNTDGPTFGNIDPPTGPTTPGQGDTPGTEQPGTPSAGSPANPTVPNPDPGRGTVPTTNLQNHQPTANGSPAFPTTPSHGTPATSPYTPGTAGNPGTYGGGGVMGPGTAGMPPGARGASGTGTGMPFLPMGGMGGAGGADNSRDRESTTWLQEDDDVWGDNPDSVVDSRIG